MTTLKADGRDFGGVGLEVAGEKICTWELADTPLLGRDCLLDCVGRGAAAGGDGIRDLFLDAAQGVGASRIEHGPRHGTSLPRRVAG
jgi:hypothetical protein